MASAAPATAPASESEARHIAEQSRIAELGHVNADVPGGEVCSEEEAGRGDQQGKSSAGPVDRLSGHRRDHEQERQRERQAPKAGSDRPNPRQADQPRPEGERRTAREDGRESERMGSAVGHEPRIAGRPGLGLRPVLLAKIVERERC
jgi:hypothetical protein